MVTGIIICHRLLAFELVNAVQKILGHTEYVYAFSNDNLAPQMIYENIIDVIKKNNANKIIAMVDLRGGSCWTVAKMITREFPQMKVISGVNVPMLISFLTKRDKLSFEELPEVLNTDAHRGILLD
jgi:mannose/fructose-specific phosphotransferase system component IIA